LSDTRSVDEDIEVAIKTLGLSEQAVNNIIEIHRRDSAGGVSKLLERTEFLTLAYDYADFRRCLEREPEVFEEGVYTAWETHKDGSVTVHPRIAVDLFGSQVVMDMSILIGNDKYRKRRTIGTNNAAAIDILNNMDEKSKEAFQARMQGKKEDK
jgi:hypothetical protein